MRDGPRWFPQDFSCPAVLRCRLEWSTASLTRLSRSAAPLSSGFCCPGLRRIAGPTTPGGALRHPRFGLLRVRSPLLAESLLFSLPAGTEMFQFPAFAPASAGDGIAPAGFPHSEIRASTGICPLTRLFAAYHVLLRLREPQASPVRPYLLSFLFFAFSNMTFSRFSFGLLRLAPVDLAFRPARLLLSSPDCLRGLRPVAVSFRFALPSCQ